MKYEQFIQSKQRKTNQIGFEAPALNHNLFDFQEYIVRIALRMGRFAIFSECGTGKTLMQLEWANQVSVHTNKPVLILAPLAVAGQTIQEGQRFGIKVSKYGSCKIENIVPGIYITNYEQLENIDCSIFAGIVLDESSILKNFTGKYRNLIIEKFIETRFKLACTATPSPNDELEIGNHAEFLGVMSSRDMRAIFFTTDKEIINGNKYRLKQHAEFDFYKWISTWAIVISNPSDLGFDGTSYTLPALNFHEHRIVTTKKENGLLFNDISVSATDFNAELRLTKVQRMEAVAKIVNGSDENFIIWIKQNEEADYLKTHIPCAVEVRGDDTPEKKEKLLLGFGNDEFRILITKTRIAQFGLNYQNCRNQIFASPDFSFEALYQAIRRSYRFGQKLQVNIHLIVTDTMQNVISSIKNKEQKFKKMQRGIIKMMNQEVKPITIIDELHVITGSNYRLIPGDAIEKTRNIPTESIDYTFFSPPFGALYVFSNDPRDLSNVRNDDEFMQHFEYLVPELFRITKPGRLLSMHIMQGTTLLGQEGYYSIKDFRGEVIRLFQKYGFHFHAENMIRKDPKTAAIRTKNRQLMHGTTKADSSVVRPGLADYIITFKKPGENLEPIRNNIPFDLWCQIAEPVWIDINEGDTLAFRNARDDKDERHLTPTQLKPIEWCYLMWTNKGDTVFTPFAGICSEIYQAILMGRKGLGIELKSSYLIAGAKNCREAESLLNQLQLIQ